MVILKLSDILVWSLLFGPVSWRSQDGKMIRVFVFGVIETVCVLNGLSDSGSGRIVRSLIGSFRTRSPQSDGAYK